MFLKHKKIDFNLQKNIFFLKWKCIIPENVPFVPVLCVGGHHVPGEHHHHQRVFLQTKICRSREENKTTNTVTPCVTRLCRLVRKKKNHLTLIGCLMKKILLYFQSSHSIHLMNYMVKTLYHDSSGIEKFKIHQK